MTIKQAESFLKFGWEITRKAWEGTKYVKKASCSPIFDIVTVATNSMEEYTASDEDWYARDWEIYNKQNWPTPSLT